MSEKTDFFVKANKLLLTMKISDTELRLLMLIMLYSYKTGKCWASKNTMAGDMHTSVRTVERTLKKLADKNIIFIEHKQNRKGGTARNHYQVNDELLKLLGSTKVANNI